MIYLQAALFCEARSLISDLQLKALPALGRFQRWGDGETLLTLSGTGPYAACTCAAMTLAGRDREAGDLFVSLGTCAALTDRAEIGALYHVHAIRDLASGHVVYPDMLLDLHLPEASLLTGARVLEEQKRSVWYLDNTQEADELPALYDMESAAVYAAASHVLGPERMVFLRLVTDCGDAARLTQEDITRSMQAHRDALLRACHRFHQMASLLSQQREDPLQAHRQTVEQTASALRASVSMKLQLEQLLRYAELSGLPWREVLEAYRDSGFLPVGSRKEGKERLEQLMRDLTDPAGEPHLC